MKMSGRHSYLMPIAVALVVATTGALADFDAAMQHFKGGKYVEAAGEFQQLVDQSPNYDYGYFMLGLCFVKMDEFSDAEQNFKKAIELNGDRFEYHHGLANAYYLRKQYGNSVGALKTAEGLADSPVKKFQLHQLRGYAYAGLEKWSDAIVDLEEARKVKTTPRILSELAKSYYELGHYDKALPVLREAEKAAPNNVAVMARLTNSLINLATETRDESKKKLYYTEGLAAAQKYQKLKPGNIDANNLVGRAALGAKQYDVAEQAFRKVLALKADHCYAMVNLGKVYIGKQNWTKAEAILEDAGECAPRMSIVFESLGFVTQKQKRLDDAVKYYEMALAIKPSASTQSMLDNAKKNIEIADENRKMDELDKKQQEEERKAREEYEAELAKQKAWEEKKKRDQ